MSWLGILLTSVGSNGVVAVPDVDDRLVNHHQVGATDDFFKTPRAANQVLFSFAIERTFDDMSFILISEVFPQHDKTTIIQILVGFEEELRQGAIAQILSHILHPHEIVLVALLELEIFNSTAEGGMVVVVVLGHVADSSAQQLCGLFDDVDVAVNLGEHRRDASIAATNFQDTNVILRGKRLLIEGSSCLVVFVKLLAFLTFLVQHAFGF